MDTSFTPSNDELFGNLCRLANLVTPGSRATRLAKQDRWWLSFTPESDRRYMNIPVPLRTAFMEALAESLPDVVPTADFMASQIIGALGQPVLVGPVVYRGPETAKQWCLTTATYTIKEFFAAVIDFDNLESADEARVALMAALRERSVEVLDFDEELEMAQRAAIIWPSERTEKALAELKADITNNAQGKDILADFEAIEACDQFLAESGGGGTRSLDDWLLALPPGVREHIRRTILEEGGKDLLIRPPEAPIGRRPS